MVVKHINNDNEFQQSLEESGENKLIICDFFAEWFGFLYFLYYSNF